MKGSMFIKLGIFFMSMSLIVFGVKQADSLFKDFNNDYLLSRIVITDTKDAYTEFSDKVNDYKESISTFYDSLDFYYDQFLEKNKTFTKNAENVEQSLNALEYSALELFSDCKYDIDDDEMTNICKMYKTNLNNTMDSYEKLVIDYNDIIKQYNEYASYKNKEEAKLYERNISSKLSTITENIKEKD